MEYATNLTHVPIAERVLMLKGTDLFAETPENVLRSIVPIMHELVLRPNEKLFEKGDLGNSLFLVYQGEIEVIDGQQSLACFGKGEFFGELSLLDAAPRSASALATSDVILFRLDQKDFYDVMEECAEVLRAILRVLCQRLRQQNEKMRPAGPPT